MYAYWHMNYKHIHKAQEYKTDCKAQVMSLGTANLFISCSLSPLTKIPATPLLSVN